MSDVAFYRPNASHDAFRVFTPWGYGEWDMADVATNITEISATSAATSSGAITPLMVNASVVELAVKMGTGGAGSSTFAFCCGGHGNVSRTTKTIKVDGVDKTTVAPEYYLGGTTIVVDQVFNLLLPANNSVVTGTYELKHTVTSAGMKVDKIFTFAAPPQYEWYTEYAAMLPLEGFTKIQLGSTGAVQNFTYPSSTALTMNRGDHSSVITASSSNHPYAMQLTYPSGYPDSSGSWADSVNDGNFWIDQTAPKFYGCGISTEFAYRKSAYSRSATAIYQILKP